MLWQSLEWKDDGVGGELEDPGFNRHVLEAEALSVQKLSPKEQSKAFDWP